MCNIILFDLSLFIYQYNEQGQAFNILVILNALLHDYFCNQLSLMFYFTVYTTIIKQHAEIIIIIIILDAAT